MKTMTKETIKFKLKETRAKMLEIEQTIDYATSYEEICEIIDALKSIEETVHGSKAMVNYELDRSYLPHNNPFNTEKIKYSMIKKAA